MTIPKEFHKEFPRIPQKFLKLSEVNNVDNQLTCKKQVDFDTSKNFQRIPKRFPKDCPKIPQKFLTQKFKIQICFANKKYLTLPEKPEIKN